MFELAPLWKRILHVFLALFYVSCLAHRLAVTTYLMIQEELNLATILCGSSFLVLLVAVSAACGSSRATVELKGLLNSFESVLRSIEEVTGERVELLSYTQLCLEIIAVPCGAVMAAVNAAAFSIVFEDLQVSVFPTFRRLGMIPETSLPTIVWQIGFFPLELLILVPPMCAAIFSGCAVRKCQTILQLFAGRLRLVSSFRSFTKNSSIQEFDF